MRIVLALLTAAVLALPLPGCALSFRSVTSSSAVTLAPGLTLHLTMALFDASRYDVITDDESGYVLGTADCDKWHGSDEGVPEIVVTAGWVVRNGQRLDLDTSCMDTYDPGPEYRDEAIGTFEAEPLAEPGTWKITGRFSDGASSAEVDWTVGLTATTRDRLLSGPDLIGR